MSYILDALRKAELRKGQHRRPAAMPPSLARSSDPGATAQRRVGPWIAVALIVAANAGVVAWLLGPSSPPTPSPAGSPPAPGTGLVLAPVQIPSAPGATTGAGSERPRSSGTSGDATARPAAPRVDPPPPAAQAPSRSPEPTATRPPATAAPARVPAPTPAARDVEAPRGPGSARPSPAPDAGATGTGAGAPAPPGASPLTGVGSPAPRAGSPVPSPAPAPATPAPRFARRPEMGAVPGAPPGRGMPAPAAPSTPAEVIARLKLQMLVYSDAPADRLVFINNQKYVEGQAIDGQVVVEAITPETAIVSYQGQRYTLRQ